MGSRILHGPNPQFTTITQAINAASPGDEIDICPALYAEQLLITKPLTLQGISVDNVNRLLIQPTSLTPPVASLLSEAVVTVINTHDVVIRNLTVDARNNSVAGCVPTFVGYPFLQRFRRPWYELLAGRRAFDSLGAVLRDNPAPLDSPAASVVMQCVAKNPSQRYRTIAEVRAALEQVPLDSVQTQAVTLLH